MTALTTTLLNPATEWELQRQLAEAARAGTPIELIGAGTRREIGRPVQAAATMSTASLTGIKLYEPTELVMSARSGTTLARIEADLAAQGQMLAFEPIDIGPVLGAAAGKGTIGAVFATNLSGARRIQAGAARDHLIGVHAVAGSGADFRSGGRVMKNVTGLDLARALTGSWGTLAALTEVTFKVLPRPEQTATLILLGLDDEIAVEALSSAMASPWEVTAASHLQRSLAARLWHKGIAAEERAVSAIRLETFAKFLPYRIERLKELLRPYGDVHVVDQENSLMFWDELRQLSILQGSRDPLWRISTAPGKGPDLVRRINRFMPAKVLYDWSGGLVWAEVSELADAGAADIRRVVAALGGHATLIRAEPAIRAAVDVFHPLEPGPAAIAARLKALFDPAGILNPGRMTAA